MEAIFAGAATAVGTPRVQRPQELITKPAADGAAYAATYGYVACTASEILRPTSTAELAAAIKDTSKRAAAAGRPLKLRASHSEFGSMVGFPCPSGGKPGANGKPPLLAAVNMDRMNRVLSVDKAASQITVQAQMSVRDLAAASRAAGLSTPRSTLPWWAELTLAGVIATTAHGSGFKVTHQLCDYLLNVTWVDATGGVHTHPRDSDEVRAMCGGVGVLGVLAEVSLQLTPESNTRLSTRHMVNDANLASDIEALLKISPNLIITWRPDLDLYSAHLQRPAPDNAANVITGARAGILPALRAPASTILGPVLRLWKANQRENPLSIAANKIMCLLGREVSAPVTWAEVVRDGKTQRLLEGVVPTNDITSVDCRQDCAWTSPDLDAAGQDLHFGIEKARLAEYIADVKALITKDLKGTPGILQGHRCLPPGLYIIRFGAPADGLLAMAAGLREPVFAQNTMVGSRSEPDMPTPYEWVQEAWEQLLLCKYEGRPHFGKNWPRTFTHPTCKIAARYGDGFGKLARLQSRYDPGRVFEPEMFRRSAAGESYTPAPRCALRRECYCSADEHCAAGFVCTPTLALPQYKVCKPALRH